MKETVIENLMTPAMDMGKGMRKVYITEDTYEPR